MAEFRPSALLKDPVLAAVAGLRVAEARGDAAIDERSLLRFLLDFDAQGRSPLASLDQLIEFGEYAAAEELLATLLHASEPADAELRTCESRLEAARRESLRETTEHTRFEIERVRSGGADLAPAISSAATEVVDAAYRSRDAVAERLGALRKLVEQHVAARRDALRARVEALDAQMPCTEVAARARAALERGHLDIVQGLLDDPSPSSASLAALTAPRSKPWIESTGLPDALQWLVSGSAPPGFVDRWRPAEGEREAWEMARALRALLESWPPSPDAFHRFVVSVDRLLGGTGDVEPPVATEGALSSRLPALRLVDAPWFRPASYPGGLLLVLPAVSGAGVPASVGPEELVLALRLREALQTDRRAIRVEGTQLIPLLSDPYRRVNVWRLLGARAPLPLALIPLNDLLRNRDGTHWTPDLSHVRHVARVAVDFLALDTAPALVDGIVQVSGGVPVLGLALLEALFNVVQDRTTGRTGVVDMGDLGAAFWHELYLSRVWSLCLSPLEGDRKALATFAAVRCACGSRAESRFTIPLEEVIEWAAMAGLEAVATRAALGKLQALGLLELRTGDLGEMVTGQRSGLALVAARKQGPPEEVLTSAI